MLTILQGILWKKKMVSLPTEVPKINDNVNMHFMWVELNKYIDNLLPRINILDLNEWRILIMISSRATNGIGVFKRSMRYPSDKEYVISISICIPDESQAPYGLREVKESFFKPLNEKFFILDPEFEQYESLYSYIFESAKRAIDLAFTKGIVCGGKRMKLQN